jgi:ABC-type phosphonate transport system ATPase subunit
MPLSKDCPVCGYDHPIHTGPGDPDECIAYLGHVVRNLAHELAVLRTNQGGYDQMTDREKALLSIYRMSDSQRDMLLSLLWNYMKQDPENPNRVQTTWGTKTRDGLIACIERIAYREITAK